MIRLSIVIPVLNQWALTEACLRSLAEHTPGRFYHVVVVDNGSTDETPRSCPGLLEALFPERWTCLRREENTNFGPACNAGARAVEAGQVFFLNNDTELTPDWAAPLLRALRDNPRLGAVSPLLVYPQPRPDTLRVQHLGVAFDPNMHPVHLFESFPAAHPAVRRARRLQAVSAAALLLPRDVFWECGGFHEGYRNGSEDLDLCCALARRGKRVACEPASVVLHHTSRTEGRYRFVEHNAKLLNERCRGCFTSDLHRIARQEGFGVRLSDWLEPYLVEDSGGQPPVGSIGADPGELAALLRAHPLHEQAYALLGDQLEAAGLVAEALDWQELCARFFPRVEHFVRAAALAEQAGDAERRTHWAARLAHVQTQLHEPRMLVERARDNAAWFRESGEQDMAALYQAWLERISRT